MGNCFGSNISQENTYKRDFTKNSKEIVNTFKRDLTRNGEVMIVDHTNIADAVNDIIQQELDIIQKMSMCNINNIKINKTTDINILYIEDNQVYFFLIKQILKKHFKGDINLIWKDNITDGYTYIKNNEIDLILLDRTLGDGTGDDLIYKLKDEDYNIKKIVLISVIDELKDVEKFNKLGLNYYIKPLKVQEFVKIMNIIFNRF